MLMDADKSAQISEKVFTKNLTILELNSKIVNLQDDKSRSRKRIGIARYTI